MKPLLAVFALLSVQQCLLPSPTESPPGALEGDGGIGYPFLAREHPSCHPVLVQADGGWERLPYDGGEPPLLDAGLPQRNYLVPDCDLESLRLRTTTLPAPGEGIDAPTAELRTSAALMVGEWTGTRTSVETEEHPVRVIFFDSGEYSMVTDVCSPDPEIRCIDHQPSWRLDEGNDIQAEGKLGWVHHPRALDAWMKHVRVNQKELTFDLWYDNRGPTSYRLFRDGRDPCAGMRLESCP